jgi:hypothetical protein
VSSGRSRWPSTRRKPFLASARPAAVHRRHGVHGVDLGRAALRPDAAKRGSGPSRTHRPTSSGGSVFNRRRWTSIHAAPTQQQAPHGGGAGCTLPPMATAGLDSSSTPGVHSPPTELVVVPGRRPARWSKPRAPRATGAWPHPASAASPKGQSGCTWMSPCFSRLQPRQETLRPRPMKGSPDARGCFSRLQPRQETLRPRPMKQAPAPSDRPRLDRDQVPTVHGGRRRGTRR